ncbi:hypothetical protein BU24DRAFT_405533 [Aaosphaeria arxii CBS 175.79]|uniref:Homeobox domain-containing protein n=1 Tax=Aaosphaeria arxii CBS 175.79 TaxID=1450172 RepID=A0A6A5XZQ2_9PLEO|nr:uncharacterized protein BU24DRAFT_405533 [Aaosphaeria arxii CBS 175.79]KAF2018778.1 hypothetical protein BU24DRAFT_405533 [Aaosphaeria arxii CBS 175.79]
MDPFGSRKMHVFPNNGDSLSQLPQSQQTGAPKLGAGVPPKQHPNGGDVKPRLTKEQHDILEAHFQQQHKPSTNTKKGFAETLGVPLDKINNWFQNRRAKVKQDIKKQMNSYNMTMGIYGPPQDLMVGSQFVSTTDQQQSQPSHHHSQSLSQDFFPTVPTNADVSPTCHPVQNTEGPSANLDLGSQMALHPPFDMNTLRSINEAGRTEFDPGTVMQSFMAATAGASFMQNQAVSHPQQEPEFTFDPSSLNSGLTFSTSNGLDNGAAPTQDSFSGFPDFSTYQFSTLTAPQASNPMEHQLSAGEVSSEHSPFSGSQAAQPTSEPIDSSISSIASMYSGWIGDKASKFSTTNDDDDGLDTPYNLPQASVSDHGLNFWGHGFPRTGMYQHGNASAQAVLSSPQQHDRQSSAGAVDFENPLFFSDDAFSRRNSSASNLATNIEAINIQNSHTPDGFKHPNPPSTIAARRQKRPTALNSSTLRSSSYSGSMPSPSANAEHTLRRIRSSGIGNASGRVQKSTPGSAQRSPMTSTFAEAAASPKFARAFSASSAATQSQGGSLAPPTPLTPNGFPHWQSNAVIRNSSSVPEHSSPESLGVNRSTGPLSAGLFSSGASPPCTPLEVGLVNQATLASEELYRDTPPQSAPATQQTFQRNPYMYPPQMRSGFHSTTDLTIAQPKPSHFRRPSLPGGGHPQLDASQMQYSMQFNDMYDQKYMDMSMNGIHHNVPFAPPAVMPEFLVHEYLPPTGMGPGQMMRRTTEPQPKSYIFANQGPGDFRS